MNLLYIDCGMGAAGDMLMAALLELHPDPDDFIARLNRVNIPSVSIAALPDRKCGIAGTHISVMVGGIEEEAGDSEANRHAHQEHSAEACGQCPHADAHNLHTIEAVISELNLPEEVKRDVREVYDLIAGAESRVHQVPVSEIHFHEVGSMDALADITGVCLLIRELAPDRILASPIQVGSGQVRCRHGILPVPAPATAFLLQGIPTYGGAIQGELCTPTGAALLRYFVSSFGPQPVMNVRKIGYGTGKKDFEAANCVRTLLGDTADTQDTILELSCNLDDMTPEAVGFATSLLMDHGALDVYTTCIQMKKNRPGILFTCLCREEQRQELMQLMFHSTSTLGIRERTWSRSVLDRTEQVLQTEYGPVRVKQASGWGAERKKAEYEDLAAIARKNGLSWAEVMKLKAKLEQ